MNVYNQTGESVEQIELSSDLLEAEINKDVLHQVVVMHLANARQGTASTKTRADVRGSGKKLYRQKGTGMARAGSRRSPIRVGGGVAFGPKPKDYGYKVPRKVRLLAIKCALADKFQNDNVVVVDAINLEHPKTKQMISIMESIGVSRDKKTLFVLDAPDENVFYSVRNIPRVGVCIWESLNTYDILWYDKLVVTRNALGKIEERWAKGKEQAAEVDE